MYRLIIIVMMVYTIGRKLTKQDRKIISLAWIFCQATQVNNNPLDVASPRYCHFSIV